MKLTMHSLLVACRYSAESFWNERVGPIVAPPHTRTRPRRPPIGWRRRRGELAPQRARLPFPRPLSARYGIALHLPLFVLFVGARDQSLS